MHHNGVMAAAKQVRRSVTLPTRLAEQVERIAKKRRLSDNRVLVELVEQGLEAQEEKEKALFRTGGTLSGSGRSKGSEATGG